MATRLSIPAISSPLNRLPASRRVRIMQPLTLYLTGAFYTVPLGGLYKRQKAGCLRQAIMCSSC